MSAHADSAVEHAPTYSPRAPVEPEKPAEERGAQGFAAAPTALPLDFLGLADSCDVGDVEDAARVIVSHAARRSGGYVCFCNVHLLTLALHDSDIHDALEGAWKRLPDGAPVAWLQRRAGSSTARRIAGPDLMPRVVDLGRESGLRHFLLGSTSDVTSRLEQVLRTQYPGVEIVGSHSPPFVESTSPDLDNIHAISDADPHIVWCALGAPKQELWMRRCASSFPGVVFLGVGAAFDFLSDRESRAPQWMQDRGLEWLHRLATEPARLGRRYLTTNTEFLVRTGLELARRRLAP
jgi:N-acetylglucosaminyldiphosphoundecaprenol N-acetyl-beta-D-mannosaminyltransferase